jgi:hypothetical protein
MDPETTWILTEYWDQVKPVHTKALDKRERDAAKMWGNNYGPGKPLHPERRFTSELEAWTAAVDRARLAVVSAEASLTKARERLEKCLKRRSRVQA